jgi:hypothetical protein
MVHTICLWLITRMCFHDRHCLDYNRVGCMPWTYHRPPPKKKNLGGQGVHGTLEFRVYLEPNFTWNCLYSHFPLSFCTFVAMMLTHACMVSQRLALRTRPTTLVCSLVHNASLLQCPSLPLRWKVSVYRCNCRPILNYFPNYPSHQSLDTN